MGDFMHAVKKQQTPVTGTDLVPYARAEMEKHKHELNRLLEAVDLIEIKTNLQEIEGVTLAGKLKDLKTRIDKVRKQAIEEPSKQVKDINTFAKGFTSPIDMAINKLKGKLKRFGDWKLLEQRKQQKLIEKANRKLQEELDKEAKRSGIEAPKATPIEAPPIKRQAIGEGATMHTRKQWKCIIEDPEKVPREYCRPDQNLLNQAVKAGIREIAGCRIFEDEIPVLR